MNSPVATSAQGLAAWPNSLMKAPTGLGTAKPSPSISRPRSGATQQRIAHQPRHHDACDPVAVSTVPVDLDQRDHAGELHRGRDDNRDHDRPEAGRPERHGAERDAHEANIGIGRVQPAQRTRWSGSGAGTSAPSAASVPRMPPPKAATKPQSSTWLNGACAVTSNSSAGSARLTTKRLSALVTAASSSPNQAGDRAGQDQREDRKCRPQNRLQGLLRPRRG